MRDLPWYHVLHPFAIVRSIIDQDVPNWLANQFWSRRWCQRTAALSTLNPLLGPLYFWRLRWLLLSIHNCFCLFLFRLCWKRIWCVVWYDLVLKSLLLYIFLLFFFLSKVSKCFLLLQHYYYSYQTRRSYYYHWQYCVCAFKCVCYRDSPVVSLRYRAICNIVRGTTFAVHTIVIRHVRAQRVALWQHFFSLAFDFGRSVCISSTRIVAL